MIKTLGFFIITMLSGEVWVTENPVNCDKFFAATIDHKPGAYSKTLEGMT